MRIHSRLNNPSAHYPLAAASMILGRGVPCLYYGDELGEQGKPGGPEGDLAMRRAIDLRDALANQNAKDIARCTAELVALRRSHEALRDADADQVPLAHTNETMAFARVAHGGASAVVAFNNSDNSQRMTLPVGEKIGAHDGCEFEEPLEPFDVGSLLVEEWSEAFRAAGDKERADFWEVQRHLLQRLADRLKDHRDGGTRTKDSKDSFLDRGSSVGGGPTGPTSILGGNPGVINLPPGDYSGFVARTRRDDDDLYFDI